MGSLKIKINLKKMTQLKQIYKCKICGNVVEILVTGQGELVCCGQLMKLQEEENKDEGKEKHVPVIQNQNGKVIIRVGEVDHPMEENHYVQWIEIFGKNESCKKMLKPGDEPQAIFEVDHEVNKVRIYCNVHGLWEISKN